MTLDPVEAIAQTMLYEGYAVWPYRHSAIKNQRRWTLGGVYPRGFCEDAAEGSDGWQLRCEVLLEGGAQTRVEVELRFLQLVHRQVLALQGPKLLPVDELELSDETWLTWDEATERRHACRSELGALVMQPVAQPLVIVAAGDYEDVVDGGQQVGGVSRSWEAIRADIQLSAERLGPRLCRLRARVANESRWRGRERAEAHRRTLLSTHLVLRARGGAFHSLVDPPHGLGDESRACDNVGVWPVLVGDPGRRDTVLASPILLEDYPCVAPAAADDSFDGGEIDQLLLLEGMCVSGEDEQRVMATTDSHTRSLLECARALSRDQLMQLHGTFRGRK